jgi:hypothetical protein
MPSPSLIEALLAFASKELTPELAAKLNNLVEANTDPTAAVAKDKTARDIDPENVEKAIDLLQGTSKNSRRWQTRTSLG